MTKWEKQKKRKFRYYLIVVLSKNCTELNIASYSKKGKENRKVTWKP